MLIVNLLGLVLIGLIVWWFWLYKPSAAVLAKGVVSISVENGIYSPAQVRVQADEPIILSFVRKDSSPCSAIVKFDDLGLSEELPLNKAQEIKLESLKPGKYPFTCQMQMYRGELIVEGQNNE
ncbi:MAG: cupredoxin domain-containing protein [Neptuniibacter sp.]